jgi:hypothetical protein
MRTLPQPTTTLSAICITLLFGCSGSSVTSPGASATGGSQSMGGDTSSGGAQAGNANTAGGSVGTGGATTPSNSTPATGGAPTGGTASGGANTGGIKATGGTSNQGGTPATGGAPTTGGTPAIGGTSATGGAPVTGGTKATGGSKASGGTKSTGGATTMGGSTTAGGTTSAGGSTAAAGTGCTGGPLTTSVPNCVIVPPPSTGDYHQDCVDTINKIRHDCMCLPPLQRWTDGEACADQMANYDTTQNSAHAGFIARLCTPGGTAENECPGWGSVSSITQGTTRQESCLSMMWHEVDTPTGQQGHYVAMSSTTYTKVACGINTSTTNVWALQNFSR